MGGVTPPLVLVAHGSRDEAAHACVGEIVDAVRAALPGVCVRSGYVDVRGPTVADAVAGLPGAVVVPAFLAAGFAPRSGASNSSTLLPASSRAGNGVTGC